MKTIEKNSITQPILKILIVIMSKKSSKRPQVSATITDELLAEISAMAIKNNRSISEMVFILLKQAVKEKLRKRSGSKEDNS